MKDDLSGMSEGYDLMEFRERFTGTCPIFSLDKISSSEVIKSFVSKSLA